MQEGRELQERCLCDASIDREGGRRGGSSFFHVLYFSIVFNFHKIVFINFHKTYLRGSASMIDDDVCYDLQISFVQFFHAASQLLLRTVLAVQVVEVRWKIALSITPDCRFRLDCCLPVGAVNSDAVPVWLIRKPNSRLPGIDAVI